MVVARGWMGFTASAACNWLNDFQTIPGLQLDRCESRARQDDAVMLDDDLRRSPAAVQQELSDRAGNRDLSFLTVGDDGNPVNAH